MVLVVLIAIHIGVMFATKWCEGDLMEDCEKKILYDWTWYHFLARWGVVLLLITIILAIFRQIPRQLHGGIPWRVWRYVHSLLYVFYIFISFHVVIYTYGYSYGSLSNLDVWADTTTSVPKMHFAIALYDTILAAIAILYRLTMWIRGFFSDHWFVTKAWWENPRSYVVEAKYMPHRNPRDPPSTFSASSSSDPNAPLLAQADTKSYGDGDTSTSNDCLSHPLLMCINHLSYSFMNQFRIFIVWRFELRIP